MSSNYTQYLGAKRCCDLKVQGPQGPQGVPGPASVGPMGYQGATGAQGFQGATGRSCMGPTGAQGPQGFQGPAGITGAQGFQGVTGAQGVTGPSLINTLQQVLDAGNTATGASATIGLTNTATGGTANPQLTLNNSNATAGTSNGIPSVEYYKSGRNVVVGDIIEENLYYANNYLGTKTLFGKTECTVTSSSLGAGDDGALDFYTCVNGTSSLVLRLNGAGNENNSFRPLDMNGNNIRSTTGDMTITTVGSSGTGTITISPKLLGNLILQNLPTSSAGLPSGAIWSNGGVLNIIP